jgi:sulfur-carrier protein
VTLRLLYFAWVREKIGRGEEVIAVPEGVETIVALIDRLAGQGGGHAEAFADRARLRAARDQVFVPLDAPIGDAREVAIFPPVTGG